MNCLTDAFVFSVASQERYADFYAPMPSGSLWYAAGQSERSNLVASIAEHGAERGRSAAVQAFRSIFSLPSFC